MKFTILKQSQNSFSKSFEFCKVDILEENVILHELQFYNKHLWSLGQKHNSTNITVLQLNFQKLEISRF